MELKEPVLRIEARRRERTGAEMEQKNTPRNHGANSGEDERRAPVQNRVRTGRCNGPKRESGEAGTGAEIVQKLVIINYIKLILL